MGRRGGVRRAPGGLERDAPAVRVLPEVGRPAARVWAALVSLRGGPPKFLERKVQSFLAGRARAPLHKRRERSRHSDQSATKIVVAL